MAFFARRSPEPLDEPYNRGDRQAGKSQSADPDEDVEHALERGDTERILGMGRRRHFDGPGSEHHREHQQGQARDQRAWEPTPGAGRKPSRREQQQDQGDRDAEGERARGGLERVPRVFLGGAAPEDAESSDEEQPADRVPRNAPDEHGPDARVRAEERDAQERERLTGERVVQRREDHGGDEEHGPDDEQQPDHPAHAAGLRSPRTVHGTDGCIPANGRKGGQTCWSAGGNPP